MLVLAHADGHRAQAASGPWQKTEFVEARLVSAVEGTGELKVVPLGIEVRLKEHWKTYWRSPGEAGGVPPSYVEMMITTSRSFHKCSTS